MLIVGGRYDAPSSAEDALLDAEANLEYRISTVNNQVSDRHHSHLAETYNWHLGMSLVSFVVNA